MGKKLLSAKIPCLDVGVLVVVDPDTAVAGELSQVGHQAGLAHAGVPLDQDRVVAEGDHAAQVGQVALHLLRQDVALVGHRLQGALRVQMLTIH